MKRRAMSMSIGLLAPRMDEEVRRMEPRIIEAGCVYGGKTTTTAFASAPRRPSRQRGSFAAECRWPSSSPLIPPRTQRAGPCPLYWEGISGGVGTDEEQAKASEPRPSLSAKESRGAAQPLHND
jgi:hypothetical protein